MHRKNLDGIAVQKMIINNCVIIYGMIPGFINKERSYENDG